MTVKQRPSSKQAKSPCLKEKLGNYVVIFKQTIQIILLLYTAFLIWKVSYRTELGKYHREEKEL